MPHGATGRRGINMLLASLLVLLSLVQQCAAQSGAHNVARGCSVQFDTPPSYWGCTDAEDALQLTDGQRCTSGRIWTERGCVGWQQRLWVLFTLDLGKVQPISGLAYSTAAGVAGVTWPSSLLVFVSDDGKTWRLAGDLVALAAESPPPLGDYSCFTFTTNALGTRGRYVKLAVRTTDGPYIFTDEVEVYEGDSALMDMEPEGPVISDVAAYLLDSQVTQAVRARLAADLESVRKALDDTKLPESEKAPLHARIEALRREAESISIEHSEDFRAVLPLNELHNELFRVHASLLSASGLPEVLAWRKHRFDPLGLFEAPQAAPDGIELSISLMQGEFRADGFLLTNTTQQAITARLRIKDVPGAPNPDWLQVASVPWTDTAELLPVASALVAAPYEDGAFTLELLSGLTSKVWLTVDSSRLAKGKYEGRVVVEGYGGELAVPLGIRVSRLELGTPRLSLGMWDYTDAEGYGGVGPGNLEEAIALMRSHFVDSPWAHAGVLPWPNEAGFDASQHLTHELDFSALDEWLTRWPGARHYMVFASVGTTFAGVEMGTRVFEERVAIWAQALAEHMVERGMQPGQLALLLVDEPREDSMDQIVATWARALKGSGLLVFSDPIWERPDLTFHQDALLLADILCPNLSLYADGAEESRDYYKRLRAQGKQLWFYNCDGPTRAFDPDAYYRRMAWQAFNEGATGVGFWAFGDLGHGLSSWNEYTVQGTSFSPVFLDQDSVTDSLYWQAVREGIEDYEYLAMLQDAGESTTDLAFRQRALELLAEIAEQVPLLKGRRYQWTLERDRSLLDHYRLAVLDLLENQEQGKD